MSVDISLPDGVNITGNVIKGKGAVKVNGRIASIKLGANSFIITK